MANTTSTHSDLSDRSGDLNGQNARALDAMRRTIEGGSDSKTIFVDFDHTLLLANSSEKFLNCARPATFFAPLLKLLGALQPWRIAGANGKFIWRDLIRFVVVMLLAPWTPFLFRGQAQRIFARHLNTHLDDMLKTVDPSQIVIVSFGFKFVIEAMLKGTRYENALLVAPGVFEMARFRRGGKIEMLADLGIVPDSSKDVLITDSREDDADLVAQTRHPLVVQWPENDSAGALEGAYVPLFYTARIKRSPSFLIKQVLLEEMLLIMIAFSVFSGAFSLSLLAGIGCLMTAFLLVYEIGYAENDRIGFQTEESPKLTQNFFRYRGYKLQPYAWVWATTATVLGIWAFNDATNSAALARLNLSGLGMGLAGHTALVAAWMGVIALGTLQLLYLQQGSAAFARVRLFPLHIIKYFGLVVLLPLHFICFALLTAQIVRTWSIYAIRRAGGDVDYVASQLVRLFVFGMMLTLLSVSMGLAAVFGAWQTWALLAFCALRAAPEAWKKLFRQPTETPPWNSAVRPASRPARRSFGLSTIKAPCLNRRGVFR